MLYCRNILLGVKVSEVFILLRRLQQCIMQSFSTRQARISRSQMWHQYESVWKWRLPYLTVCWCTGTPNDYTCSTNTVFSIFRLFRVGAATSQKSRRSAFQARWESEETCKITWRVGTALSHGIQTRISSFLSIIVLLVNTIVTTVAFTRRSGTFPHVHLTVHSSCRYVLPIMTELHSPYHACS